MAGNVIFRGPIEKQGRTVSLPVNGALLPGTWVEDTAGDLTQLATAAGKRPLILSNIEFKDQDVRKAYTDGETGVAYEVEPGMVFQSALAAANYAKNDPLTIAASGRLAAAASGDPIVAFFDDTPGAFAEGALADVIVATMSPAA